METKRRMLEKAKKHSEECLDIVCSQISVSVRTSKDWLKKWENFLTEIDRLVLINRIKHKNQLNDLGSR